MNVVFLIDVRGPVDGKDIGRFKAGDVAEVSSVLARKLIASQIAAEYVEPVAATSDEPAPEIARDANGYPVAD